MTAHSVVIDRSRSSASERLAHVVQHAEKQRDVERSERAQVAFHEVGDDRFDVAVERGAGTVEAALAEQRGPVPVLAAGSPHVMRFVARFARMDVLPVFVGACEVERPHELVEGDDALRAGGLGAEREPAVPRADVDDRPARQVGKMQGLPLVLLHAGRLLARCDRTVGQLDRVPPEQPVRVDRHGAGQ